MDRLFTIKKNQLKLTERRGYNIDREKNLLLITSKDFEKAYVPFAEKNKKSVRAILSQNYEKQLGDGKVEKLYVYFADNPDTSQLGVDGVSDFIDEMDKFKSKNGILITPKPLSPSARKNIESLISYNISIFTEDEMMYDPTEHFLTPDHIGMKPDEQRDFLQRNNISIDQLPVILTSDMIVRYYGFKLGQVVKILRTNLYDTMVQNTISYRVVKEDTYK